jgi:hypothetical protein
LFIAAAAAIAQTESLGAPRMRAIALQSQPPGPISQPYVEILDTVADAVDHSTLEVAADRFARFLDRQREAGRKGVPNGYIDYVMHRVAVKLSDAAAAAAERAGWFHAQENAVLEHLSLLEKQHSDRAGSRLPDFVLREPVLGEFGQDAAPVQRGLPQTVSVNDLPSRIAAWRETLDRVSGERTNALRDFDTAVRADSELLRKLADAEARLAAVVQTVFAD